MPPAPPAVCCTGLTADQAFSFDVRGYVAIPGALSPATLAAVAAPLDAFEAMATDYRAAHPEVTDERVEAVEGRPVGLHIQDGGSKLWVFDLLSTAPELAGHLAANAAVRPWVEELVPSPSLGLFAARYQWQGAESAIHGSFVREAATGPGVRRGSAADVTAGEPGYIVQPLPPAGTGVADGGGGAADARPRLQTSMFRLMYLLSDIEPGGGALRVIPG